MSSRRDDGLSIAIWENSPWRSFVRFRGSPDTEGTSSHPTGRVPMSQVFREEAAQSSLDPEDVRGIFGRAMDAARSRKSFASAAGLTQSRNTYTRSETRLMMEDAARWRKDNRLKVKHGAKGYDDGDDEASDGEGCSYGPLDDLTSAGESFTPFGDSRISEVTQAVPRSAAASTTLLTPGASSDINSHATNPGILAGLPSPNQRMATATGMSSLSDLEAANMSSSGGHTSASSNTCTWGPSQDPHLHLHASIGEMTGAGYAAVLPGPHPHMNPPAHLHPRTPIRLHLGAPSGDAPQPLYPAPCPLSPMGTRPGSGSPIGDPPPWTPTPPGGITSPVVNAGRSRPRPGYPTPHPHAGAGNNRGAKLLHVQAAAAPHRTRADLHATRTPLASSGSLGAAAAAAASGATMTKHPSTRRRSSSSYSCVVHHAETRAGAAAASGGGVPRQSHSTEPWGGAAAPGGAGSNGSGEAWAGPRRGVMLRHVGGTSRRHPAVGDDQRATGKGPSNGLLADRAGLRSSGGPRPVGRSSFVPSSGPPVRGGSWGQVDFGLRQR